MKQKTNAGWPVLTHYDQDHLARIAMPLGGIGTGCVSLGGRGQLQDWEIVNRPAKGFTPDRCFFAVRARPADGRAVARVCEGIVPEEFYEGPSGSRAANHGLPRFRECSFAAAYPTAQVMLSDPDVPVNVRLEAFNPMIPADVDASSIPIAVLRYVVTNTTNKPVSASVLGSVMNFIGSDGSSAAGGGNRNQFRKTNAVQGIFMTAEGTKKTAEQWGTMALTTTAKTGVGCSAGWSQGGWGRSVLDFWEDFLADGKLEPRKQARGPSPVGSLCVSFRLAPRAAKAVTFLLTWHFPNRQTWTPKKAPKGRRDGDCTKANTIGNYYCTQYKDAFDAAVKTARRLDKLEAGTVRFLEAFCSADLPQAVKEAGLNTASTLRTQTCFRTPDGLFFGWEGQQDRGGCCFGSCTHVWNYEQATPHIFGELACKMREVEFAHATRKDGAMSFRVSLPIERAQESQLAAADGQMGCLIKLYRDWQLSGDDAMLRRLWPHARRAIAFCWLPGGWDADKDGVMEGCQHNTMDVEYFGPNPQMQAWYLGALRASEEMASYVGDADFAADCRRLFDKGSKWMDEKLFNGEYYEHHIRPKKRASDIHPATGRAKYENNPKLLPHPDSQLGAGCLVDQLVGQFVANVADLGDLLSKSHVRKTLRSILKYNYRENFSGHFNNMRSFVMNDEPALLMASYPRGRRPKYPFPYFTEVMTGFEYAAAVHMLQEGMTAMGLRCIQAVRDRYDGKKRSPFNEAECGHHYARAMASWAAITTLTGFKYSGVRRSLQFAPTRKSSQVFWSNGYAWGTFRQRPAAKGTAVELTVLHGRLKLRELGLAGVGTVKARTLPAGSTFKAVIK